MKEELITFETAKLAKEKGFDEVTDINYYEDYNYKLESNFNGLKHSDGNNYFISAPTQSLLQKWLRDKHNIHIQCEVRVTYGEYKKSFVNLYQMNVFTISGDMKNHTTFTGNYNTYEEALEAGLVEALKLIKV